VALERRDDNLYYYRSVRDGEKIRRVYVGAGEFARIFAEEDLLRRTNRKAQREEERAELERLEALAAPLEELSEAAEVLAHAYLVAAGFHEHRGEWRRTRSA
jgi:tRNA U55 pseudouridine synthase TruB